MSPRRFPRMAGFGLIELMIALVLGLLVVGAASAIFLSNQRTYNATEGVNRMQESARAAFELMAREARAAGGSACSNTASVDPTNAQSIAFLDGVAVVNDANDDLDSARDQVTMVSGDDTAYRVTDATNSSVTVDLAGTGLTTLTDAFEVDDQVLVCSVSHFAVVTLTGVGTDSLSFDALPYVLTDGTAPASVMVARFRSNRWFVGENERGGNSLWVSRNGGAAQEVAEGVEALRAQYLENTVQSGCPGAAAYVDAPGNVRCVNSLRLQMRLSGEDVDGRALTRDFDTVVSLRSRNP